jgi:hypothetical protein
MLVVEEEVVAPQVLLQLLVLEVLVVVLLGQQVVAHQAHLQILAVAEVEHPVLLVEIMEATAVPVSSSSPILHKA